MGKACAIIPKVINKQKEKVDSRLFMDLLSTLPNAGDRPDVVRIYQKTKNPQFVREWNPRLQLDDNGEPTLRSLLKNTDLKDTIGQTKILNKLNKDIGAFKRGTKKILGHKKTPENYHKLASQARRFNANSEYRDEYVADVIDVYNSDLQRQEYGIQVTEKTKEKAHKAEKLEHNESLNDKLRSILAEKGVSVGALTDLEERMGINGVTEFNKAQKTAEGTIQLIRIAKGEKGEMALPEEFAHFALAALGSDNLLANRLINLVAQDNLAKEILGDEYWAYNNRYAGNKVKLAKEAAGKLISKHLTNSNIPNKSYKNLLSRVVTSIKNFFRNISESSIQRAMREADNTAGNIAKGILNGSIIDQIKLENITETEEFYNLEERVQRDKDLLESIRNSELKRYHIYKGRHKSESFSVAQEALIKNIESHIAQDTIIEGIYEYIQETLTTLKNLSERLKQIVEDPNASLNKKASVLRDIRNYFYSYEFIYDEVLKALLEEGSESDNRYGERVKVAVESTIVLLRTLKSNYEKAAMPLFVEFIKPYIGDGITVPFGKYKGATFTAEEIVKKARQDISFFDRWLDSMADSSNYVLKILDQAVKESKEMARLDTISISKEIKAAAVLLEQAGYKDTEWMFERNSNGKVTENYISKTSKQYEDLSDAQKAYYNTIIDIKAQLDSYLPPNYTSLLNSVKIRKDLLERVKGAENLTEGAKQIWKNVKDQFVRRGDDTEFGDRAALKDFEGRRVQMLPIYYTKIREGESLDDISLDVTSTMIAYAAMANDFREMNKIIDILELGRDVMNDNFKVEEQRGDSSLVERITELGRTVESKVFKNQKDARILARLDDFFEMQVYNNYMADEGTFGNSRIDKAKSANFVNKATALSNMALNVLLGISNVATGKVMMRIESFSGQFFNETDTLIADRIYGTSMPAFLGQIGKRVKTNKLALWSELFNIPQEYEKQIKEVNWDRKNWFSRMLGGSPLFFLTNAGEHWMQHRTSLALANRYKMKDPNGKEVSLWDAMEVVFIDPNNEALGAELKVKEGYTKLDGSQFTKKDVFKFSRKCAAINEKLHGIYNNLDKSAVQRVALGRMGMLYRKWIKPSLNRRWKRTNYNFDLEDWNEGFYLTLTRFLNGIRKEVAQGHFNFKAQYKELTEYEKQNMRRAFTEVGHFMLIALALALIDWSDGDDDNYMLKMLEYQMRRLYTEIGVFVPGPQMFQEALRITKQPAAGINTIEKSLDTLGILNPYNYEELLGGEDAVVKQGRFKGHNKATKLFITSPFAPMGNTLWRNLNPEEGISFYK